MKIAVIGTGNVGSSLAKSWSNTGHQIILGVRDFDSKNTQKAKELVPEAAIKSIREAVNLSDVVLLAIPPAAILDLIPEMGDISDKILIDATNSFGKKPEPYETVYHAVKEMRKTDKVVKCFNSTGYENMANPNYNGRGADMFAAGNNEEAKNTAQKLAADAGFENCYDFGGDDKVKLLEHFAASWVNLAIQQGLGRNLAFKILKR
ncbi:MAG: NAD(P)-binding domain-containing protein [Brumimicrobium sp.]|nr:NAD(P)-binding domain-containing protein [Brumimicrobium sp.]